MPGSVDDFSASIGQALHHRFGKLRTSSHQIADEARFRAVAFAQMRLHATGSHDCLCVITGCTQQKRLLRGAAATITQNFCSSIHRLFGHMTRSRQLAPQL